MLAVLRDVVSGRSMLAVSTHLFWDPAYPDIKAAQAHILCHEARSWRTSSLSVTMNFASHRVVNASDALHCCGVCAGSGASLCIGLLRCDAPLKVSNVVQMRAFADVQWLSRPVVLLGGDFNSLWRKYTSDAFDEVGYPHVAPLFRVQGVGSRSTVVAFMTEAVNLIERWKCQVTAQE